MFNELKYKREIIPRIHDYLRDEADETFRREVEILLRENRTDELYDRFFQTLEFGTGGMRGKIGGGSNRMNTFVVRQVTQGLANYLKKSGSGELCAVIAYDSRRFSDLFARETALVLAANGITAFLFERITPTPILSFMVRHLNAAAGVVITASHNPPEYNGYKVFWDDGAQVIAPHDENIIAFVNRAGNNIHRIGWDDAVQDGRIVMVRDDAEDAYYTMVEKKLTVFRSLASRVKEIRILYTPLHGTGLQPVSRVFRNLSVPFRVVEAQRDPDPAFTNAPNPNPENPQAFNFAVQMLSGYRPDIVIATDPDADRLAIAIPDGDGLRLLNGNEAGVLFLYFILTTRLSALREPKNAYIIKTIVTSELQRKIAEHYGVRCIDTLTGFKNIGGVMRRMEREDPECVFLFANEESCGYLIETEVRDKDGVSAAALAAELALYCRANGTTLPELLKEIYTRFGYYHETQVAKTYEGEAGMSIIRSIMEELRTNPERLFADRKIRLFKDYKTRTIMDKVTGKTCGIIDLPPSDVLQFHIADGSLITARPSGTEPKIKFYFSLCMQPPFIIEEAEHSLLKKTESFHALLENYLEEKRI